MKQHSAAQRVSSDTDMPAHNLQPDSSSWTGDAQRHIIERLIQKIPQLVRKPRDDTTATGVDDLELLKVINMPRIVNLGRPGESFVAVQEWEGVVNEIRSDVFLADLVDITAQAVEANELAEIPIADIQEKDRQWFRVGAIFRWVVGYHRTAGGTKTRGSRIHFRWPVQPDSETKILDLVFEDRPSE
jgi:hypothetical protein